MSRNRELADLIAGGFTEADIPADCSDTFTLGDQGDEGTCATVKATQSPATDYYRQNPVRF